MEKERKKNNKTSYQWYPGHMTKAVRMMRSQISLVDMLIEIVDARIPFSSRNPDIDELCGKNGSEKKRLIILNKSDMADEAQSKKWAEHFASKDISALSFNSKANTSSEKIIKVIKTILNDKIVRNRAKGLNTDLSVMVAGIPNVGKSTFINRLAGRAIARTGNKPGVTKGQQWIALGGGVRLLDTPGILWPKFEDDRTGRNLALIGSLNDNNLDIQTLAIELIRILDKYYGSVLGEAYSYTDKDCEDCMEERAYLIKEAADLELIALKRGCIQRGGVPDFERAASILLTDYRSGKLGRFTLEHISDL